MIRFTILAFAAVIGAHGQEKPPAKQTPGAKPAVKPAKPAAASPKPTTAKPIPSLKPPPAPKAGATLIPTLDIPKLPEAKVVLVNSARPARQAAADLGLGLKASPPREFAALAPVEFTLANGMRVILHEDARLPWVAGNLRIAAGSAFDPPLKAGLAEILMRTILAGGGTGSSLEKQRKRAEAAGAILQPDTGERASSLVFRSDSDSFSEVLKIVASSVTAPSFDEDAIEESRAHLRNRVAGRNNSIDLIVNRESHASVLGGWAPPRVEYATLANVGQEDLRLFYAQHLGPSATALIVSGGFSAAVVRPEIEKLFGEWKGTTRGRAPGAESPAPAGVRFAEAARAQAAAFAFARTGPDLGSPESAPAAVLAELLSGGTSSRLFELSQTKQSWALKTLSGLDASPGRPSVFTIRGLCDTPYPVDAMMGILDEAAEIRKGRVTDGAVDIARRMAMSAWIAQFPNALSRLTFDEGARGAGLAPDFAALHYKALSAVRKADVVRAAQTLLDPQSLHVTVVGNATLMNRPLAEFRTPVRPVELTIPLSQPLETPADPAAIAQGKLWLAKLQEALGGAAKLAEVKDLEVVADGTHLNTQLKLTDRWMAPGTLRQDQETKAGVTSVFYNGEIGWVGSAGRVAPLNPGMLMQVRGELLRLLPLLALSDRDPSRTVSHGGANVLMVTQKSGAGVRIYLDEATNLPARLVYQTVNAANLPAMAEETWSEWKESGGIRFPGKIVLRLDGRRAGEMTVASVKVNSGLKALEVERKP